MPAQDQELLARGRVPDAHRPVVATYGEPRAVGAEGHAGDLAGVPAEGGEDLAAGSHVPDPGRTILTPCGEPRAVGAKREARGRIGMPAQDLELSAGRGVEDAHLRGLVLPLQADGDRSTVRTVGRD